MNPLPRSALLLILCIITLTTSAQNARTTVAQEARNDVAAVVNGRTITLQEVDESVASKVFALQQQLHAIRTSALDNLVAAALLEEEAKKKGVTAEELRADLMSAPVSIPPAEVEQAYAENAAALASLGEAAARERVRLDLETEARIRRYRDTIERLRGSATIAMQLPEPRLRMKDHADAPAVGNDTAPVVVTMFTDYECPYCKSEQKAVRQLLASRPEQVRVVYRHLPLNVHPHAFASARAAWCADRQGRFTAYHDALFDGRSLDDDALRAAAAKVGLDAAQFARCAASDESQLGVTRDVQSAKRAGITTTPSYLVNGRVLRGAIGFDALDAAVAGELAQSSGGK